MVRDNNNDNKMRLVVPGVTVVVLVAVVRVVDSQYYRTGYSAGPLPPFPP